MVEYGPIPCISYVHVQGVCLMYKMYKLYING